MKYIRVYGILYSCPFGTRKSDCPLIALEHLSFEEKFRWFENLSTDAKDALVDQHMKCVIKRESSN